MTTLPPDIDQVLADAWQRTRLIPGHLGENEARLLGIMAACTPADGVIVEIGSFKGRSTVMLASVAGHYGLGPVVAIDPHNAPSVTDPKISPGSSTFEQFRASIRTSGVESFVEAHRASSQEISRTWKRPIRLLWIDGDHTYRGVKLDFDGFSPYLSPGAVVAFHDSLNAFEGPIRIFLERVLRDERFGAAGFVHSVAWSQFRPANSPAIETKRRTLERRASRMLPFLQDGRPVAGLRKMLYKLARSRVPRAALSPAEWNALIW